MLAYEIRVNLKIIEKELGNYMITKQALESTLFGVAEILRGKVEDYKAYILSLLFFKRLSDNYEWEPENGRKPSEKKSKINTAHEQAEKERQAIDDVEQELITLLQDTELRKRYFAVADMEELEGNAFNLNIPRYVDTFETEEEIISQLNSFDEENLLKQTKIQTLQRLEKSLLQNLLTVKVRLPTDFIKKARVDIEAINKIINEQ
ncbi:MAG: type I restriction-modification system subunit M N-terminal domain-containing protein [Bacteroidales bacterium]|nr:type I restriction-modification system subunit M N-terminal domain-containing protein [Bacteroidales bacterium]